MSICVHFDRGSDRNHRSQRNTNTPKTSWCPSFWKSGHQAFVRIEPLTYAGDIFGHGQTLSHHQESSRHNRSWKFVSLVRAGTVTSGIPDPVSISLTGGMARNGVGELAGATPAEALEAQRRKRNELIGEAVARSPRKLSTESRPPLPLARTKSVQAGCSILASNRFGGA